MAWTHHFLGTEMVMGENCSPEEYKTFYYKEQEIVKWILYDQESPCKGMDEQI